MNEVTPMEQEALIILRYIYMAFCIWIYNLRISFPKDDILLAFIYISSCFVDHISTLTWQEHLDS